MGLFYLNRSNNNLEQKSRRPQSIQKIANGRPWLNLHTEVPIITRSSFA